MITHDTRAVLEGMRGRLEAFSPDESVAGLDALVSRLSCALDALVGRVDAEWLEELRSAWWPLEYINASVLGDGRFTLTPSEVESVARSKAEFLALLIEY